MTVVLMPAGTVFLQERHSAVNKTRRAQTRSVYFHLLTVNIQTTCVEFGGIYLANCTACMVTSAPLIRAEPFSVKISICFA